MDKARVRVTRRKGVRMDAEADRRRERLDQHIEQLKNSADGILERVQGNENDGKAILVLLKAQIVLLQAIEWQIGGIYEEAKQSNKIQSGVRSVVERIWYAILIGAVVLAILSQIK